MRKPRDFDAVLKTLTGKTRALQETKRRQLGELIVATGADAIDIEILAGGLLAIAGNTDAAQKENWRKHGAAFFRGKSRPSAGRTGGDLQRNQAGDRGALPAPSATRST